MKSLHALQIVLLLTMSSVAEADETSTQPAEGLRRNVPASFALKGARVVTEAGRAIDGAVILVRKGRIQSVGKDVDIPDDVQAIDLTGQTIYPGLIDAYTEQSVSTDAAQAGAPYWNSQVRPQLRVAGQYRRDLKANAAARKMGVTAQLVAPAGGVLKGAGSVVLTSDVEQSQVVVRADVTQHIRLTVDRGRDTYPKSPMGAVALARQAFYDADWYRQAHRAAANDSTLSRPVRNDALQALNDARDQNTPFVVDTSNELFFLRADRFAREFGLNLIVRGSGNEYRRLEEIRATGRPVIVPVNFPKPPNVGTYESALDVTLESLMHWDHAPQNAAKLEKAGIRFALCSQGMSDHSKFLEHVRKAVSRGLSEDGALRALTTVPAELFGVGSDLGKIEPGKLANFVVTDGPLFESGTNITETWIVGERFEHDVPPARTVAGHWQFDIGASKRRKKSDLGWQLVLTVDGKKLSGTLKRAKSDDVPLDQVVLNGARLSGTLDASGFGREGIVRFTVVIQAESNRGQGHITWADGTRTTLTLTRAPIPESSNKEDSKDKPDETDDGDHSTEAVEPELQPASFPVNFPLGGFGVDGPAAVTSLIVFKDATVWTCGPDGLLETASVLVKDGVIIDVGNDVHIPKGALVVDAKGMHLTPGIIDCHSHMATDGGINESGQAVTAEVRIGDFVDCDDINIYRQLAGGVTTSNILHGSANPIGGQNQVIKLRWGAIDSEMKFAEAPQGIKFALGENVKQSNWGDEHTTRYPQTRMGVEQMFIDEFRAAQEYTDHWSRWKRDHRGLPPRRDLELEAVAEILQQTRWIHCHSYRQDEILALIRVLDHFHIRIGTFQHILEGYKVADAMAKHGAMGSAFSDWWAYKFEVYDSIPYGGALMHNAGVVVSFNSDDRELARHLNHEAAKAVKYGNVPPVEALKFVTLNPARQLRIDQYVGSIERGKHADLVLWSGSPLSTMSRCEQTWIDGRKYFDRTDDLQRRMQNRKMRAALIQKILDSGESMRKPGEGDGDPASLWPREDLFCHGHDHDHLHTHRDEHRHGD